MNKNKIEKIILIILFAFIGVYVFYTYQVKPVIEDVDRQNEEIIILENKVNSLKQYEEKNLKKAIDTTKNNLIEISRILPDEEQKTELIDFFYNKGVEYNLQGSNLSFESIKGVEYDGLYVTLSFVGQHINVEQFIRDMQMTKFRLMKIDKFTVIKEEELGISTINMRIEIIKVLKNESAK